MHGCGCKHYDVKQYFASWICMYNYCIYIYIHTIIIVNVLQMKCWRSLVGVSRMDRVRNEEVRRRAAWNRKGVSELSRSESSGMWKERMSTVWPEGC